MATDISGHPVKGANGAAGVVNRVAAIATVKAGERAERRTITPEEARRILARSRTKNRNLDLKVVRQLASDMQTGRFEFNGEPVILSDEDDILDGHHRLNACVEADTPFDTLVVTGVKKRVMHTIDTGISRDRTDVLEIEGVGNAKGVGTLARWVWAAETDTLPSVGKGGRSVGFTNTELVATVQRHPGLVDAVGRGQQFNRRFKRCSACMFAFALYWLARYDAAKAEAFVTALADGENLTRTSPVAMLRQRFTNDVRGRGISATDMVERLALLIKAWRAFYHGREVNVLKWMSTEAFPSCDPNE